MTKKLHPIRKMLDYLDNAIWWNEKGSTGQAEKIVMRSVKPLLDALEAEHGMGCDDPGPACSVCRLLAEWKAKL